MEVVQAFRPARTADLKVRTTTDHEGRNYERSSMDADDRLRARRRRDHENCASARTPFQRAVLRRDEKSGSAGTSDEVPLQEPSLVPVFPGARRKGTERRMANRAGTGRVAYANRMDTGNAQGGNGDQSIGPALAR